MKILVAIDGSPNSLRALDHAITLAGRLKEPTQLVLANAHDDIALRGASQFVGKDAVHGYLNDLALSELGNAMEAARRAQVPFETRMAVGPVSAALVKVATDEACDLIVLGSKGRTALKDLLIG